MDQFPPFPGFRKKAFDFLRDLSENNDRDWFKPRKDIYDDELIWPLRCLVADATRQFNGQKIPLKGDPKKSLFRIYRDTRFSKDKTPYKTHVSAVLSRSGSLKEQGGVYIHVEPRNCFFASGFWQPDPKLLRALRERMADDPGAFLGLVQSLKRKKLELAPHGEGLKRLPKGFESVDDPKIVPYLKWKSYVVSRNMPQKAAAAPGFTKDVVKFGKDVLPLLEYGWEVM